MANGGWLIVDEKNVGNDFFDLSSGVAGEVMQKFTNYHQQLAIVVADPTRYSKPFQDLVHEHSQHSVIRFPLSHDAAMQWLSQ